jgi:hypothetical protein
MSHGTRIRKVLDHVNPSTPDAVSGLRIRQVAWVVRDLDTSATQLQDSLRLSAPYVDPEIHLLGVTNRVFALGGDFLEMVSPLDSKDNTAAKQLERRKGDGGYMVMLQTTSFEAELARLTSEGFKVVLDTTREEMEEVHLHPKDTVRCIFSLSQPHPTDSSWVWGGPDWPELVKKSEALAAGIKSTTIQAEDFDAAVLKCKRLLNTEPTVVGPFRARFLLAGGKQALYVVRATDGRGDGLAELELVAADGTRKGRSLNIGGMRVLLS